MKHRLLLVVLTVALWLTAAGTTAAELPVLTPVLAASSSIEPWIPVWESILATPADLGRPPEPETFLPRAGPLRALDGITGTSFPDGYTILDEIASDCLGTTWFTYNQPYPNPIILALETVPSPFGPYGFALRQEVFGNMYAYCEHRFVRRRFEFSPPLPPGSRIGMFLEAVRYCDSCYYDAAGVLVVPYCGGIQANYLYCATHGGIYTDNPYIRYVRTLPNGFKGPLEVPIDWTPAPIDAVEIYLSNYCCFGHNYAILDHIGWAPPVAVAVTDLQVFPGTLLIGSDGAGSGVVFRATTDEPATITFWLRDPQGVTHPLGQVGTTFDGAAHVAKLSWWGRLPDGTLAEAGGWTVLADRGGPEREAAFFVRHVEAALVGLGTWMKDTKDPAAQLPREVAMRRCPTCPWEQLLQWAPGLFSAITVDDPVNLVSGNFLWPDIDATLQSRLPLMLARIYNSLDPHAGPFGPGWSSPYLSRLEFLASDVLFVNADGSRVRFERDGEGFKTLPGIELTLSLATDTGFWRLAHPYGSEWHFDDQGRIVRMSKACCGLGAADAVDVTYDAQGRLHRVTNPAGQWLEFAHGADGRIITVTDLTGRAWQYGYSPEGLLLAVTDPAGRQTSYGYNDDGFLTRIERPGAKVTTVDYQDRRAVAVTQPDGTRAQFAWDLASPTLTLTDTAGTEHRYGFTEAWRFTDYAVPAAGVAKVFVSSGAALTGFTNALGANESYQYRADSLVGSKTDAMGATTAFDYDARFHLPTRLTDPLGRIWQYEWCHRGNLVAVTAPDGGTTRYTFDSHNNKLTETDPKGRVTRYSYDPGGNFLLAITDPQGDVTSFTYDLRGNKTAIKNPLGQITRHEFDVLDREVKTITSDGRWVATSYDDAGQVTAVEESDGTRTSWTYDAKGRRLTETTADGAVTRFEYDTAGRMVAVTDPLGNVTRTEHDALGRAIRTIRADGTDEQTTYDVEGRVVTTRDPCGAVTRTEYDAAGRAVARIDALGNRWVTEYDLAGQVVAEVDPLGRRTVSVYDAGGRLLETVRPDGSRIRNQYDADGRLIANTDPLGNVTRYEYNARGQRVKTIRPNGAVLQSEINAMGHEVATIDPLGRRTETRYDTLARPYQTVDPAGGITQRSWDPVSGLLVATRKPDGSVSSTTYDLLDRPVVETDALGHETRFEYDLGGRQVAVVDPLGRRRITTYDVMGRVVAEVDPEGHTVLSAYDACGRRVSLTDGAGRVWRWEYDLLGRVVAEIDPLGHRVTMAYDAVGNLLSKTNARGQVMVFGHDAMNRLERVTYPDGTVASFTWDLLGRELSRTWPEGGVVKTWDSVGKLLSETFLPWGKKWEHRYDLANHRIGSTDPEGKPIVYDWDALDCVSRIDLGCSDVVTWQRDPVGRVLKMVRPGVETAMQYDAVGRPVSIEHRRQGGPAAVVASRQYVFDAAGNCLSMRDESGQVTTYGYARNDWLTAVRYPEGDRVAYTYNGAGDRLSELIERPVVVGQGRHRRVATETEVVPYSYDAGGRMVARASDTYLWDADGNQVAVVADGKETRYLWSADNRLLAVEKDLACAKHAGKKCGCGVQVEGERYGYLPQDWRRVVRETYGGAKGEAPRRGHGWGHGRGHDCGAIPGHGWGHGKHGDGDGDGDAAAFVSIYDGEDESHEYLIAAERDFDGHGGCGDRGDRGFDERGNCRVCKRERSRCGCPRPPVGPHHGPRLPRLELVRDFPGGPGMDDLVATRYRGRNLWHVTDMLGSTIALANRGGQAVARVGYDAWGVMRWPEAGNAGSPCGESELGDWLDRFEGGRGFGGPGFDGWGFGKQHAQVLSPYLYTGRRWQSLSQTFFNRNRYYFPIIGRFTSEDPIGLSRGNLWLYSSNNPAIRVDRFGKTDVVLYDDNDPVIVGTANTMFLWWQDVLLMHGSLYTTPASFFEALDRAATSFGPLVRFAVIAHGHPTDGIVYSTQPTPVANRWLSQSDIVAAGKEQILDPNCRKLLRPDQFSFSSFAMFASCFSAENGTALAFSRAANVMTKGRRGLIMFADYRYDWWNGEHYVYVNPVWDMRVHHYLWVRYPGY